LGRSVRALFAIPLCVAVGACSGVPYQPSQAPKTSDRVVQDTARVIFAESKLPGTALTSQIKAAHPISRGDWVLCVKSSDPAQTRRYAIYFTDGKMVHWQLAAQIDACEDETYAPAT
jgi:hypothetical protein